MAAVVVPGWHFDRQIRETQFLVGGHLCPHAGVARVRPGIFLPRVDAELARLRNRVEDPQPLPRPDIEAAHVAFLVAPALGIGAGPMRGADDDDVLGDERRRVQTDLAGDQIHFLIVVELQIDDAGLAERGDGNAVLRIERDESIARRHV